MLGAPPLLPPPSLGSTWCPNALWAWPFALFPSSLWLEDGPEAAGPAAAWTLPEARIPASLTLCPLCRLRWPPGKQHPVKALVTPQCSLVRGILQACVHQISMRFHVSVYQPPDTVLGSWDSGQRVIGYSCPLGDGSHQRSCVQLAPQARSLTLPPTRLSLCLPLLRRLRR